MPFILKQSNSVSTNNSSTPDFDKYQIATKSPVDHIIMGYTASGCLFQMVVQYKEENPDNQAFMNKEIIPNIGSYADFLMDKESDENNPSMTPLLDFDRMIGFSNTQGFTRSKTLRSKVAGIALTVISHEQGTKLYAGVAYGSVKIALKKINNDHPEIILHEACDNQPAVFFKHNEGIVEAVGYTGTSINEEDINKITTQNKEIFPILEYKNTGSLGHLDSYYIGSFKSKWDLAYRYLQSWTKGHKADTDFLICEPVRGKAVNIRKWNCAIHEKLPAVISAIDTLHEKIMSAEVVDKDKLQLLHNSLVLVNRLVSDPSLENTALRYEYESMVRAIDGKPSLAWKALGAAMFSLGVVIFALSVPCMIVAAPLGIVGGIAGIGLIAAGIGIFAHGRQKGLSKAMSELHHNLENTGKTYNPGINIWPFDNVLDGPTPSFY